MEDGTGGRRRRATRDRERRGGRREAWIAAGIVLAGLAMAVPIGGLLVSVVRSTDGIDLSTPSRASRATVDPDGTASPGTPGQTPDATPGAPSPGDTPEVPGERPDPDMPDLDVEALSGIDAVYGLLLVDIDRAELLMMDAQAGLLIGSQAGPEQVAAEAGEGQRALQEHRAAVAAPIADDDARAVRDAYLGHLDAWVRYLVAIERDPALYRSDTAEERSMLGSINSTATTFARLLDERLPADVDPAVRDFAEAILDANFPSVRPGGDATPPASTVA